MLVILKYSKHSWNKSTTNGWMTRSMLIDGMEMKNHIQQKKDVFSKRIGQVKPTRNYVKMNTMILVKSCDLKQVGTSRWVQ